MRFTYLISGILSAFAMIHFASQATTPEKIDGIWATSVAAQVRKISKPEDFLKYLPLKEQDAQLIEQQIKSGQMKSFSKPKISMPNETTVMLSIQGAHASLDFREFHKGFIYLNNSKIDIRKDIDYLHYRFQVESILRKKTAMLDWALPTADAETATVPIVGLIDLTAATTSSSANARNVGQLTPGVVNLDNVQTALQHVYAMEAQSARNRKKSWSTFQFKCADGKTSDIYQGDIYAGGKVHSILANPQEASSMDVHLQIDNAPKSKTPYIYSTPTCTRVVADQKILITSRSSITACPVDATLKDQEVFQFKQFADLCCQKEGCEHNVNAIQAQMADELTGKTAQVPITPPGQEDSPPTQQ